MPGIVGRPKLGTQVAVIAIAGVLAGTAVRIAALPSPGYTGDLQQFLAWARHIAQNGLAQAYDEPLTFGPVMAYVWGLLGILDPAIRSAPDASDPALRVALKLPAAVADFGLAACVGYALRARPRWAASVGALVLVFPIGWLLSAWWGQYDSIFALFALIAYLFAVAGRDALAVIAMVLALLTKPQAAPFVFPLAGWLLATRGRTAGTASVRAAQLAALALGVIVLLWLPFLSTGGPARYLAAIAAYQGQTYAVLSFNAWNMWWPIQQVLGAGGYVSDSSAVGGIVPIRVVGYALGGGALLVVAWAVRRRGSPRQLALGMAAASLAAFTFLTTMHERYAAAGVLFLALLVEERRLRLLAVLAGSVVTLNLIAAAEARHVGRDAVLMGPLGIVGSLTVVVAAIVVLWELVRGPSAAGTPRGTSAGSGAATSGA